MIHYKSIAIGAIGIACCYYIYRTYFGGKRTHAFRNADLLGTASKSTSIFHQVLVQPDSIQLMHDGIILGFEKIGRDRQIVTGGEKREYTVKNQYQLFGIDQSLNFFDKLGLSGKAKKLVQTTLDDPKPTMLTHWFEANNGIRNMEYNAYLTIENQDYNLPEQALAEYKKIGSLIKNRLEDGGYTHLVIGCTGWQNDQTLSLETYNNWLTFISQAAKENGQASNFRPYFIGLTWPSKWVTSVVSVFNKANDADELGMTHINYLVWHEIMPLLAGMKTRIPVITIGHSFGARLLSRSNHSSFMLSDVSTGVDIDLEIDLQGAYPISRFLGKSGNNGGLYTIDPRVKQLVITTSKHDIALKTAVWSTTYAGNNKSREVIIDNSPNPPFGFAEVNKEGRISNFPVNFRNVLVNADAMIFEGGSLVTGAHSDVQDKQTGQFMWELIRKTEYHERETLRGQTAEKPK